jgi:hypothetical protein
VDAIDVLFMNIIFIFASILIFNLSSSSYILLHYIFYIFSLFHFFISFDFISFLTITFFYSYSLFKILGIGIIFLHRNNAVKISKTVKSNQKYIDKIIDFKIRRTVRRKESWQRNRRMAVVTTDKKIFSDLFVIILNETSLYWYNIGETLFDYYTNESKCAAFLKFQDII